MEDKKIYALFVIQVIFCFSFASCNNSESDFCRTWHFVEISPEMKVFYKEDSTLHNNCFSFYSDKEKGTLDITGRVIGEYFYDLPPQLQNDIRGKKIELVSTKYDNYIFELNECLNCASDFYKMDSLSYIYCNLPDFPRAAIYVSEMLTKYPDKSKHLTEIARLLKDSDNELGEAGLDKLMRETDMAIGEYYTEIARLIQETDMAKEMNGILNPFNLKVDKIRVAPEALYAYNEKKFFMEHLTDTTNMTVPDSILYVPLEISVVSSKENK